VYEGRHNSQQHMRAYFRGTLHEFISTELAALLGRLELAYGRDGFASQYTTQTRAWADVIPQLRSACESLLNRYPEAAQWFLLLEYPLYRLRRRLDVVLLAGELVVVIEVKVGAQKFLAQDIRQVEDYSLDLRDFHSGTANRRILPVLWSTDVANIGSLSLPSLGMSAVLPVVRVGSTPELVSLLLLISNSEGLGMDQINGQTWDDAPYRPVPNVIDAATQIFAGHSVREIANADADNLAVAAARIVTLVAEARARQSRYLIFLTGVPGSGKTLAGLEVVHSAVASGTEQEGDIVYLSGNSPLVVGLREALALDEHKRIRARGGD
jgi:hypothetical protein